jgi:hypothetical protein
MFVFLLLCSCSEKESDTSEEEITSGSEADDLCAYPLVSLQTSQDETCGGGRIHRWPIGMEPTDCHGWSAEDTGGNEHLNSAANMTCHDDGSFSFEQYAGNLDCLGSGVLKTYYPDECEQDIPPSLYTVAVDLSCCADPDSCASEAPSVEQSNSNIYKNGLLCSE